MTARHVTRCVEDKARWSKVWFTYLNIIIYFLDYIYSYEMNSYIYNIVKSNRILFMICTCCDPDSNWSYTQFLKNSYYCTRKSNGPPEQRYILLLLLKIDYFYYGTNLICFLAGVATMKEAMMMAAALWPVVQYAPFYYWISPCTFARKKLQ